jgi:hypothetical protein
VISLHSVANFTSYGFLEVAPSSYLRYNRRKHAPVGSAGRRLRDEALDRAGYGGAAHDGYVDG